MLSVSMPNAVTSLAFVDTATKCFATAFSSPPFPSLATPSSSQSRATFALVSVSSVVKVLEEMMNSVLAGSRSRSVSQMSVGSMLETKRIAMSRCE